MIELNKIYNEDCIQGLSKLPDSFCDLIIADPPYVISKESNFHTMPDRKNQRTSTNFGEWDKEFNNNEWIELAYQN